MAKIEFKNIWHSYDPKGTPEEKRSYALQDFNLAWEDGSANALLGPSGCGKTTLLNIISGLIVDPTKGQMLIDGEDVTSYPPQKRRIAQVFQFPVCYDTMTVYDNLAFPLRNEGADAATVRQKVSEVAEILDLTPYLKYHAGKLNAAEKQIISLGRGIIRESTAAILLDEPLTVIDPKLKWHLRRKLREVQRALKKTMIYVTHDQHEALTFADRVSVMRAGRLVQMGTPTELFYEPETPFIGYFIGSPGMNLLECQLEGEALRSGDFQLPLSAGLRARIADVGQNFTVGIRPKFVEATATASGEDKPWKTTIVENTGAYQILTLQQNELRLKARVPENFTASEGDSIWVRFPEDKIKIFHQDKKIV